MCCYCVTYVLPIGGGGQEKTIKWNRKTNGECNEKYCFSAGNLLAGDSCCG